MQDVQRTIDSHIDLFSPAEERGEFTQLAQRWASHSLATYKDELLGKALAIAKALSEFDNELLERNDSYAATPFQVQENEAQGS